MNTQLQEKLMKGWLFRPFTYIAGWQALLLGVAALLASSAIGSFSDTHFDGVIDMHTGAHTPLWIFLCEGLVDWVSLAIILLIFGVIISKTKFRVVDLLGTQALSRWPTIISAIFAIPTASASKRVGEYLLAMIRNPANLPPVSHSDVAIVVAYGVLVILMICWFIALAYRSYSISCNIKGGKAIGTFIAAILIAEVLSKCLMGWAFKTFLPQ
jgi:hypothetical protein